MSDHRDRRGVVLGLSSIAALSAAPAVAASESLSFLAIGDWGRRGELHQRDVARAMDKVAAEIGARFVLSVGDNFYPDGAASIADPHWKLSFEDVYSGQHLQTPWHVALGNHDYHGDPQAQLDYSRLAPRWNMPDRYYKLSGASLGFPHLDLFCIDTTPLMAEFTENGVERSGQAIDQQRAARQLAWLDRELGASTSPWKLVYGHHTIRSGGSVHGDTAEMVEKVLPILQRHRVPAYICGHDHDLQHIANDGLNYILTGAGSEVRPVRCVAGTRFCAAIPGFTAFRLTTSELAVSYCDTSGARLYEAVIRLGAKAA